MSALLAVRNPRAFAASAYQKAFFDWVAYGAGNAILKAVAGSGKSTSIVRALEGIPDEETVLILAFNTPIAKEMREKIAKFGEEADRNFRNVEASTFHSRGYRALLKRWGRDAKPEIDGGKVRKILKDRLSEVEYETYGDFVAKLVGFAKGLGFGIPGLVPHMNDGDAWRAIIATQDMWLDDEDASEDHAIDIAFKALRASNAKAESEKWIDFDDQLYLPLLWNLRLYAHDWVFVDEAQDTNPVRRLFARRCLKPRGRFVAVGDPRQAIYAFTGASSDAMDQIAREFGTTELPLTVSYRCPKAVGRLARAIVPYFEVAEDAIEGEVLELPAKPARKGERGAFDGLDARDMILCRQTAPLISLAFAFIAEGRGCFVLGKDIGAGLSSLVKKLRPKGVPNLVERLNAYFDKENAKFAKESAAAKAEALADRIACVKTVIESLPEGRSVPDVLARIESLFADGTGAGLLPLSTMHKSKGREARRVAIYRPELCPSKAAKSIEAYEQEMNLQYVADTRAIETLIFVEGEYK